MRERLKDAFDQVHASDALRRSARAFVSGRAYRARRSGVRALAATCALACCIGAPVAYMTPTATIHIDINPSLELRVNGFDRVVGVRALNDGGDALQREVSMRHRHYADAVDAIIKSERVAALMEGGGEMNITVDAGGRQGQRLLKGVEGCTAGKGNASCRMAGGGHAGGRGKGNGKGYGRQK